MPDYREDAKKEADEIDRKIIEVLSQKKNFRVEAGAGSGKTYSMMKVIEWLQINKQLEFKRNGKKVACLTFTNAAVDVISSRLQDDSFIAPSTIHNFAWNAIAQFQEKIIQILFENNLLPDVCDKDKIQHVQYSLGVKYFDEEERTLYLGHNDILKLFSNLLDNEKFQKILANRYPIILIDEYQDSNKEIIDKFINYYISKDSGIQFGFFGDSWQTIYGTNGACGEIVNDHIVVINKTVNFRSIEKIVDVLNKIRPEMPQKSALNDNDGKIYVVTTDAYERERRSDGMFKGDLPAPVLKTYVESVKKKFDENLTDNEKIEILMLTHRILADQQGYPVLFELLGDGLKDGDDDLLCYLRDVVFPLIESIIENDMIGICEILKISKYPIQKKADKVKWSSLKTIFSDIDGKTIFECLSILKENEVLSFPEKINLIYNKMKDDSTESYQKGTYAQLKEVKVLEFKKVVAFISPETQYSTDHGVKGEEYDSVLFVIGKGWNLYQFDKWMPRANESLNEKDRKSFERNRNLFYVCCSRAKRNLILFVTIPIEGTSFRTYLENLVGPENIITYEQYLGLN